MGAEVLQVGASVKVIRGRSAGTPFSGPPEHVGRVGLVKVIDRYNKSALVQFGPPIQYGWYLFDDLRVLTPSPTEQAAPPEAMEPWDPTTHPLYPVLRAAIEQAALGKGERHGGLKEEFLAQPWTLYARRHGRGFLTGQAAKKLDEAVQRGLTGEPFEQELLGAIVYIGMAILWDREHRQ